MQLKLRNLKDLAAVWRTDFMGQKGFLIPPKMKLQIGQELFLDISVDAEPWGRVETVVVWHNIHRPATSSLPRGFFLRLIQTDPDFQQKLTMAGL